MKGLFIQHMTRPFNSSSIPLEAATNKNVVPITKQESHWAYGTGVIHLNEIHDRTLISLGVKGVAV